MRAHTMNRAATARVPRFEDPVLLLRIRGEFAEMPGLKLTLPQASRLFHLEAERCERVLASLVASGQLVVRGNMFVQTPSA